MTSPRALVSLSKKTLVRSALVACCFATLSTQHAFGVLTQVNHADALLRCDTLIMPVDVDEIGFSGIFPPPSSLDSSVFNPTQERPCPSFDNPQLPNQVVSMFNTSGRDFSEVWYVADEGTTISNADGRANHISSPAAFPAFRIDNLISDPTGSHHPLIFESGPVDGQWQDGEEWRFVLQDYTNAMGLGAGDFSSIGVGVQSAFTTAGVANSSGSIVTVPEPTGLALLLGFVPWLAIRKRRP